ncbi:MAG: DMT family transporter [Blautia sp.]
MVTKDTKIQVLASLGMLLTAVIWGFAFVVVKNSLDLIPPTYMLAFRFTIAAGVLALVFWRRLKRLTKEILAEGVILGVFLFVSYLFQTIGCQYTTAGKNAFLTTIYVVIVPFLHWLLNKKRPDVYCVAAAFLAILGIGLLSLQGDLSIQIGDVLTLICGFGFALHMIYIDRYAKRHDPIVLTVLQLATSAVLGWVLAPVMDGGFPAGAFQQEIVVGMLYLGILSTMVGFFLQNVCQKYTTPNVASLLLSMESVFGALFSVIFLGEYLSKRMVAGCVLIFLAIILAETKFSFLPVKKRKGRVAENV